MAQDDPDIPEDKPLETPEQDFPGGLSRLWSDHTGLLHQQQNRLQRQIDVLSDGPSQALVLAERLIDNDRLNADCVEVVHLAEGHHRLEIASSHAPAPCKHA